MDSYISEWMNECLTTLQHKRYISVWNIFYEQKLQ